MKIALFIILAGVVLYANLSLFIASESIVGSIGADFSRFNQKILGLMSFLFYPFLLFVLYRWFKNTQMSYRRFEITIASVLLAFSLLIFQAMSIDSEMRGLIGASFVDFTMPYIGYIGNFLFFIVTLSVALALIFDTQLLAFFRLMKMRLSTSLKTELALEKDVDEATEYTSKNSENQHLEAAKEVGGDERTNALSSQHEAPDVHEHDKQEKQEDFLRAIEKEAESFIPDLPSLYDETKNTKQTEDEAVDSNHKAADVQPSQQQPDSNVKKSIVDQANVLKASKKALVVEELEENSKLLKEIETGEVQTPKDFTLPPLDFLSPVTHNSVEINEEALDLKIKDLLEKLNHFKIEGDVVRTYAGPVVSTFEFKPAANIKVSKILNLQDDLAMALRAQTIRIQAPIPGKDVVGIEIPNDEVETIYLREIFESELFKKSSSPLTIALGKDIVGKPFITDLKKLPHLLIAGTTGSGKSVGINAMILSLLYKNSPDQLKLLMIDPKMLEFTIYNDIPHLLTPVITKAQKAIVALNNMVAEMERRYELMAHTRTKNIENYNEKAQKEGAEKLPYIVVVIDELADLMMTSGKDVEFSIARLAQMARASGIHLIVATQRPSVDVVTGLIKANLPSRISYRVGQKVDSKIILDQLGAESLLGRGDLLFTPPGAAGVIRLHAPWSSEDEIDKIVEFLKSQREVVYDKSFLQEEKSTASIAGTPEEELDERYDEAKEIVYRDNKCSISHLQRQMRIGYNKSARIVEQLQSQGILSAPNEKGERQIL